MDSSRCRGVCPPGLASKGQRHREWSPRELVVPAARGEWPRPPGSLASEYAKNNIRFNAVAPGAVDTPIVKAIPKDFLMTLSPMGAVSEVKEVADAVIYLTEARHITGEVLHVDGGMHVGKW